MRAKLIQQWSSLRGGPIDRRAVTIDYLDTDPSVGVLLVIEVKGTDAMGHAQWLDSDQALSDLRGFMLRLAESDIEPFFGDGTSAT